MHGTISKNGGPLDLIECKSNSLDLWEFMFFDVFGFPRNQMLVEIDQPTKFSWLAATVNLEQSNAHGRFQQWTN